MTTIAPERPSAPRRAPALAVIRQRRPNAGADHAPVGAPAAVAAHPHWQGLDGLRGLAVIAVVVYHFAPGALPGGFLGVDVFFVISGYLITRLLAREFLTHGRIDAVRFWRRRARRLLPALATVLAAVSVAALVWRDQLATLRPAVLATAVFGGNWFFALSHQSYFVSVGRPSMLQHLWSLGVEEQFYLVWPIVAAATLAGAARRFARTVPAERVVRPLAIVAVVLALVSTGLTWWMADARGVPYGNDGSLLYFGTDTHCMGLLLGAALGCLGLAGARPDDGWSRRWSGLLADGVGAAALFTLICVAFAAGQYWHWLYRGGLLVVAALVCVVIGAGVRPGSQLGAALDTPALRWVGLRSYSIYLWHWPVTVVTRPGVDNGLPVWLDQLVRIVVVLALSELSYRFVESPARRIGLRAAATALAATLRRHWRSWPPRPAAVGSGCFAAVSLLALGVLLVGPAAPRTAASLQLGAGGRHLLLGPAAPPAHPAAARQRSGQRRYRQPPGHHTGRRHPSASPLRHGSPATHLPRLSGYGDSVLLGARAALGRTFPGGSIDAVEGRQARPTLADARADARRGRLHRLVVIATGNNGLIDPADLQHALQAMSHAAAVLVLTDHLIPSDDPWQNPNNATIERIVPRFRNARIVPWDRIAARHPGWLWSDRIHLTPAGATGFARTIKRAWLAAER